MARPGAVGDDADAAVETDVLQVVLTSHLLALVEFFGRPVLVPLGVTEAGVVVEADLGVERVHPAVGTQDERVDLGQVAVALGEAAVQLDQHVGDTVDGVGVDAWRRPPPGERPSGEMPSTGSMCSMTIASGLVAATVSISTPPSALSISRCFFAARSSEYEA